MIIREISDKWYRLDTPQRLVFFGYSREHVRHKLACWMIERLKKDARFMKVLPTQGNAYLIDAVEVIKISRTMLDAAERIEALEAMLAATNEKQS